MASHKVKKWFVFSLVLGLLLGAMLLRVAPPAGAGSLAAPLLRNAIHIGLLIFWSICVANRVMQPQALKLLLGIAGLMLLWFVVRLCKYEFVENPTLLRFLWYLYYLPMLFIPLCALFTAMLLGKSELAHLPGYAAILSGISGFLFLLVMTNDLHQLVFRFPAGSVPSDSDYGYGPVYYCIVLWLVLCGISFLVILLTKCRIPQSRTFIWLPGMPVFLLLGYTVLYLFRVPWLFTLFGDLPVAFCLCYVAVLESCMQTGLIQTNTGYDMLFEASSLQAQITDTGWNTRYYSGSSPLDANTLAKAENTPIFLNPGTLLKTSRIAGGHVAWQENVAERTDTLAQLEENQKELEDENYLEQESLRVRQEVLRLQEKSRLYDLIGRYTRPQTEMLNGLLQAFGRAEAEADRHRILEKSCVLAAYIKRCGNLLLIQESCREAPVSELANAIEESLENLTLTGGECSLTTAHRGRISTAVQLEAYTCFQRVVEAIWGTFTCLWVNLRVKDGDFLLQMEAETGASLPDFDFSAQVPAEDGVKKITFRFPLGGDKA